MSRLQLFRVIPIILFLTSLHSSMVNGFCSFEDESTPLTSRHIPPHAHLISYPPLSKIMEVNYPNISEVYTALVERHQSATTLKNIMARRISQDFPPPHQHCFIQERNESLFLYNPASTSDNHTSRLIEDTVLLYNASKALQMMIDYERTSNISVTTNLTVSFLYLKISLDNIIDSLSNVTGVSVRETDIIGSGDGSEENQPSHSNRNTDDEENSGTTYNTNDNEIVITRTPVPTTPTPPSNDPRSGDGDILNQANSQRYGLPGRQVAQTRHGRQARSQTAVIPAVHCMSIENDEDEFVYMYEIWIGLWYVQSDLLKIKDYISPN